MSAMGRFQLGEFVPITLVSVDGNDAPSWPTACPTIKTFAHDDLTTAIETLRPMARDLLRVTGMFYYPIRLSSSYTAGKAYLVTKSWAIGGSTYVDSDQFRVVAGGDADGGAMGAAVLRRPEAQAVVYTLNSGKLKASRNPR